VSDTIIVDGCALNQQSSTLYTVSRGDLFLSLQFDPAWSWWHGKLRIFTVTSEWMHADCTDVDRERCASKLSAIVAGIRTALAPQPAPTHAREEKGQ